MGGLSEGVRIRHVAALDGLRGLAVAGVLLFHGGHLVGGYLGVDLFFVLSGFLITSLLLRESGRTGGVALGGFWARRARRLLPALGGVLVGVALYCVVFATPGGLVQIRGDALGNACSTSRTGGRCSHSKTTGPCSTAPSPAAAHLVAGDRGAVLPRLAARLRRAPRLVEEDAPKAVLVTSTALACVSGALMLALYDPLNVSRVYYGTDTRASGILLGAALAAALVVWGDVRGRVGRVLLELVGVTGVLVLAYAWTHTEGQAARLYRGGFFVCGVAAIRGDRRSRASQARPDLRVR